MERVAKSLIISLAGVTAVLIASFLLNLTVVTMLAILFVFLVAQVAANVLYPRKNLDNFVKQTIANVEAIPDEIEHVEEDVHESLDFSKDFVAKHWRHYHNEIEKIEGELSHFVRDKEF